MQPSRIVFRAVLFVALSHPVVAQTGWTRMFNDPEIRAVHQTPTGTLLAGTYYGGVYRSLDDGAAFACVQPPRVPEYFISFAETRSGVLYALFSADLLRSDDDGATWTRCGVFGGLNGGCRLLSAAGDDVFLVAERGLYRSIGGQAWEHVSERRFSSMVALGDGRLVAQDSLTLDVSRSTDAGASWTVIGALSSRWGEFLAGRSDNVYGSRMAPALRSRDGGAHWEAFSGYPHETGGEFLALRDDGVLAVITGVRVYVSRDDGDTWTEHQTIGFPMALPPFAIDRQGRVYARQGPGLYRTTASVTSIRDGMVPAELACAIAPNPVRNNSRVFITLSYGERARVSIIDALGRTVAAVFDEWLPAGTHAVDLDAAALRPGSYRVVLQSAQRAMTVGFVRLR
jgi:photosystem II stability/assembly factor-like uncharacterized protein